RNRIMVVTNWVWNYLTLACGTRLIIGATGSRIEGNARCVRSPADAPTLEQRSRQAPQSVHVDGRIDQAGPGKTISPRTHMLRSTVRLHAMTTARQGNRHRAAHEASRVDDKSRIFRKARRNTDPKCSACGRSDAGAHRGVALALHRELQLTPQAACTH